MKKVFKTFEYFLNPFDKRFEDLTKGSVTLNVMRDVSAGLVVAMVAIPLAMGFAIASGLQPEQGIVGGAIAGLLGALFGGSKYQVYGPTAAFIPIVGGIMASYSHGFLVLTSLIAGILLMLLGLAKLGRVVALVPHSIVVGFTIGIAVVISVSQMGEVLGLEESLGYTIDDQIPKLMAQVADINLFAILLAAITFLICISLVRISVFIPGPLIALAICTLLEETILAGKGLTDVHTKYGHIPTDFIVITPPEGTIWTGKSVFDLAYYSMAIVIVAAIESLLCSRMADRLAGNTGTPFNPNKELWGQGIVNIFTPFFNGFPHTGALARTAVNIRVGAVSPLAGVMKFVFKLGLVFFLAGHLEHVPLASIAGVLAYVAFNMVKGKEVKEVVSMGKFQVLMMLATAIAVPLFGFMYAVVGAILFYVIIAKMFPKTIPATRTI